MLYGKFQVDELAMVVGERLNEKSHFETGEPMKVVNLVVAIYLSFPTAAVIGAEPVGWRTDGTGRYPNAKPPTKWSTTKNVIWKVPMPSWSNATPVVIGNRVFTCAEPDKLICLSRDEGSILWLRSNSYAEVLDPEAAQKISEMETIKRNIRKLEKQREELSAESKESADKATEKQRREIDAKLTPLREQLQSFSRYEAPHTHPANGYTSSTPVSDGKYVCMVFGTGIVSCYDLYGNRKWAKLLEKTTDGHGHCPSPLIVGDKLLVYIKDLVALQLSSGKELWRTECRSQYGSLVKAIIDDVPVVITGKGTIVRIADGKKLAGEILDMDFSTPVVQDGVVYCIEHGGKAARLKLPTVHSEEAALEVLWQTQPEKDDYYASPLVHNGLIYAITQKSVFSVIDGKDGKVIYKKKLNLGNGTVFPSITLAGDYLFVSNDNGRTLILRPGPEYKEIAANELEPFRSSPVFVGDRLYIRGLQHLYCIGP